MTEEETTQEQLSPDDDLRDTIQRFVMQSPPTEEGEVFHSLETIIGDSFDISGFKEDHFRQLHLEKFHVITLPETQEKMLITPYGELDETHYYNPKTQTVVTYEHATNTVSGTEPFEAEDTPNEAVRKAVETALQPALSKEFADAVSAVYLTNNSDGNPIIAVCFNSTQGKSSAMWSGRWKSCWIVDLNEGKCPVEGKTEVEAHFYEAGNVSFQSSREFSESVTLSSDPDAFASALVTLIMKKERSLQSEIDESFTRLSEGAFKSLRRKLPVTKTKIDWDNFALQGAIGKSN